MRAMTPPRKRWKEKSMADYHVGCGAFGIYAGTLNRKDKNLWQSKTECTDEAINAVRDWMINELLGGFDCRKRTEDAYIWELKDGRTIELRIKIMGEKHG